MTHRFRCISLVWIVLATGLTASQAFAQAPTTAQRSAIKSSCRSDYIAHCSSVQPGGAAALQCLQKNMASLSSGCQAAVKAVTSSSSDAKPAGAPAAAENKAAAEPSKPAAGAAKPAAAAAAPAAAAASPVTAAPAVAPPAPALVLRPLRPLEEARIVRAACGADARAFCSTVEPGSGRIARCLAANAASVSPACKRMLAQFAAR